MKNVFLVAFGVCIAYDGESCDTTNKTKTTTKPLSRGQAKKVAGSQVRKRIRSKSAKEGNWQSAKESAPGQQKKKK